MKKNNQLFKVLLVIIASLVFSSCDTESMKKIPVDQFVGNWELQGRSMLDGIRVSINKTESGALLGKVTEINQNKYVNFFMKPGDVLVSKIKRSSNSEFRLTEKKIGSDLFSTYGLGTSKEFKVEFIDKNTIKLGSNIVYKRVK